jgi:hypothetical protein
MPGTITQSRVKEGTFTLGPVAPASEVAEFACQTTNIRLTPSYDDDGDRLETLCGAESPPGKKESWALAGTSVQDFDDPAGFIRFCRDHATEHVPFEWLPNAVGAELVSGVVQVLALEYGGDVNSQLTTDFEFECVGKPVWEEYTPPPLADENAPEAT